MMKNRLRARKSTITATVAALILILLAGVQLSNLRKESRTEDLHRYDYRDTRQLVALTAHAADRVARVGEEAFDDFRENPGKWSLDEKSYLYVYEMDGTNLFHGGYPELEGKNLIGFTDLLGKKSVQLIIDQLVNHHELNPHGWHHYLWVPPGAIDAAWKSSCNFRVTMPDGRQVFVGSGIDAPLQEREFYRVIVDEAVELIEEKGELALPDLSAEEGPFMIHDKGVFLLNWEGSALIDPGLNLLKPRNLFAYTDLTGRKPLQKLQEKLEAGDRAWVITLDRVKAGSKPVKKGIYGRKAVMDGEEVIVGAICPLPRPAWMK